MKKKLKEIFLYGPARSGNHAIINYILGHIIRGVPGYEKKWKKRYTFRKENIHFKIPKRKLGKYSVELPFPKPKYGNLQIISHEHEKSIFIDMKELVYDTGRKNVKKKAIVILRDPYNTFASNIMRLKLRYKGNKDPVRMKGITLEKYIDTEMRIYIEAWLLYAKTFFINPCPDFIFPLKYNEWFVSKVYRETISNFIKEEHTDFGLNRVSSIGSSFDQYNYNRKAQKMPVLKRWKLIRHKYRYFFDEYPDLRILSKNIFNFAPFR